ncbi:ribosome modulation factor [Azohydromonas lata]|uniref:Uncharacterized protein n=1 Tax=Azohydromonas lata TaxID=45677 RepID=A0ABU5I9M6_9BURK|nr:hypothetical protein [Azohydromonas lata]MDZ5455803.1 hypothetical protein [Azohydromonas lata]
MTGFDAGFADPAAPCPYEALTLEAVVWRKGWVEGAAKRLGYTYDDTPTPEIAGPQPRPLPK